MKCWPKKKWRGALLTNCLTKMKLNMSKKALDMVTSSLARMMMMRVNMSREEQEMMEMNMTSSSATYKMMGKSTTTATRVKWMLTMTMTTMPGGLDAYNTTLVALVFKLTNFCCLRMMSLEWSMQEDLMVEECGALPG